MRGTEPAARGTIASVDRVALLGAAADPPAAARTRPSHCRGEEAGPAIMLGRPAARRPRGLPEHGVAGP